MARRKTKTRSRSRINPRNLPRESASQPLALRTMAIGGLGALLIIVTFIWYLSGGAGKRIIDGLYDITAHAGLRVEEIFITGRTYVNREDLMAEIGAERGTPILQLNLEDMHARLVENPWIKSARIERHLPNVLYIALNERTPYALWQHDQKLYLVDKDGNVITDKGLDPFGNLPLLVGGGAATNGADILEALDDYPEFRKNMKALVRVGDRRWDLELENGTSIKLPEASPDAALERLSKMWKTTSIASRNLKIIDARLPDRIVLDGVETEEPKAGTAQP